MLFIINEAKKRRDQVMFLILKNKKVSKQATGSQFNRGGLRAGFVRGKEAQRRLQQMPRAQVLFLTLNQDKKIQGLHPGPRPKPDSKAIEQI